MNKLLIATSIAAALFATSVRADDSVAQNLSEANKEGRIWSSFALNPHISAYKLDIDVDGETVTLAGTVEDGAERELAEVVARDVSGIKNVVNNIKVDRNYVRTPRTDDGSNLALRTSDATITARVKSRLLWNAQTDGLEINVSTDNRRVTLSGTADTDAAKLAAGRVAANTDGVRSVDNNLKVDSAFARTSSEDPIEDSWITTKVKSSFLLSQDVDGLDIKVETKNGVVKLSGTVEDDAEKKEAEEIASNIRGVKEVDMVALSID